MRLTLRTLLAYLDDRLSPANARELGQKIAKSPFATDLEERIKSVVRRRRLASDTADQKTIDPNLIAEYLDDQLTPELVALIEKEILASDFSLAEVAATHQILGLLNDPVVLSQSLKERLHKLDPAVAAETEEHPNQTATAGGNGAAWKPLAPQEVTQTRSPMILLAVMVLGWLALLATDSNLFERTAPREVTEVQQIPGQNDKNSKQPATAKGESAEDLTSGSVPEATTSPNANLVSDPGPSVSGVPSTAAEPTTTTGTSTTPAVVADVPGTLPPTVPPTTVPPTMPPAVGTPPVSSSETASTATVPETAQPQPRKVVYDVQDAEAMVLLSDAQSQTWRWAASDGRPAGEQNWTARMTESILGIAEPFESRVTAIDVGWSALVLGSSLFRGAPQSAGLELIEGRMLLQRAPSTNEPAPFVLTAGGTSITVSVPQAGKQLALQVLPLPLPVSDEPLPSDSPSVFDLVPLGLPCRVTLFAVDTDVTVQRSGETVVVVAGSQLDWVTNSDTNAPPKVAAVIPGWVLNATKPKSESTAKLISSTASEFKNFESVSDAASGVMENRNPQIAVYAAKLPVLTKSVDDLATTLLQSGETVVRKEAIAGLQSIMLTSPLGRARIKETLRTRLPEMDLDNAMKLLEGVSQVAAEDRFISSWLVGMLDNNRLALRELAIFNLEKLFSDRNGYFADDDAGRRDSAVRRWKRILDRNDGRLVTPNG